MNVDSDRTIYDTIETSFCSGSLLFQFDGRLIELVQVGDQILDLLFVLQSRIRHLGSGNLLPRILDVLREGLLVPGEVGVLVGGRVAVALRSEEHTSELQSLMSTS